MPEIKVEVSHDLGKEAAKERLMPMVEQLIPKIAGLGAKVTDLKSSWNGDVMSISGKVKKGFMSINISGEMEVFDTSIVFTLDVMAIVLKFIEEAEIKRVITKAVSDVLE